MAGRPGRLVDDPIVPGDGRSDLAVDFGWGHWPMGAQGDHDGGQQYHFQFFRFFVNSCHNGLMKPSGAFATRTGQQMVPTP